MIWAFVTALEVYLLGPVIRLAASYEWSKNYDRGWERYVYGFALFVALVFMVAALALDGQSTDEPAFVVKAILGTAILATRAVQCAESEVTRARRTKARPPRAALLYSEPRPTKDMKPSAYDADYISQATALGLKVFQCTEPVLGGYRYSLFLTRGPEVPVSEIAASRRHPLPGSAELVVDKNRALQVRRWGEELQAVALESGERVTGLLCLTPHGANALEDGQCLESGPLTVQRSGETVAIMLHNKPFGSVTADQWYAALIRAAEIMDEGPTIESGEGVFAFPLKPKPVELIDVTERVAKA